jgi:hypothetical protein
MATKPGILMALAPDDESEESLLEDEDSEGAARPKRDPSALIASIESQLLDLRRAIAELD